jgi:hypothetical protein
MHAHVPSAPGPKFWTLKLSGSQAVHLSTVSPVKHVKQVKWHLKQSLPPVSKNPVLQRQLKVGVLADYVLLEPGKQLKLNEE